MQRRKNHSGKKKYSGKKKHGRFPIHVYLIYLFVATLLFTGVTFSKYVASTNVGDGARVASFGELELVEENKPEAYIVTPGVDIAKNPLVSFAVSESSEMAAYVFVSINAKGWKHDGARTYTIPRTGTAVNLLDWSVDKDWEFLETDGEQQVFYRTVAANQSLDSVPVISEGKITVSDNLYASDYAGLNVPVKSIVFEAYAVQVQGFEDAQAAWKSVSGGQ